MRTELHCNGRGQRELHCIAMKWRMRVSNHTRAKGGGGHCCHWLGLGVVVAVINTRIGGGGASVITNAGGGHHHCGRWGLVTIGWSHCLGVCQWAVALI